MILTKIDELYKQVNELDRESVEYIIAMNSIGNLVAHLIETFKSCF